MQAEACPLFREFDYGAGGYGFGLVVDEDKFVFVVDIRVYDGLGVLEVGVAVQDEWKLKKFYWFHEENSILYKYYE